MDQYSSDKFYLNLQIFKSMPDAPRTFLIQCRFVKRTAQVYFKLLPFCSVTDLNKYFRYIVGKVIFQALMNGNWLIFFVKNINSIIMQNNFLIKVL